MRPEDVHTPEAFARFLVQQRAELAREYATPRWERVLLVVSLVAMVLVFVAGLASAVLHG